uniref:Coagulation factor VIII n=1 Tax=Pseudonaja textilis TaxID=8673 RepID=A0A670YA39_PSETE
REVKPKPAWMGLLGPIVQAEIYDKVIVTFKNMASRPFNIHAKGVSYWKASEGAGYEDLTSQLEKEDDAVEPGHTHVYVWEILEDQGPTGSDTHCLTYAYSSHVDSVKDINSGLIGPLLVCKPGEIRGKIQEFVLLFSVFDEGKRRMRGKERKEYAYAHPVFVISPKTLFFSLPADLRLCEKRPVYWYVISLGSQPEVHSILFEGHSFLVREHRLATLDISPAIFLTAETTPRTNGTFRMFCQIPSHQRGTCFKKLNNMIDGIRIWTHYIAAEEGDWDYAPVNTYSKSLESGPQRIGSKYKKAMFVEYEDGAFNKRKAPKADHLGLLGPVLQGEVGDEFVVNHRKNCRLQEPFALQFEMQKNANDQLSARSINPQIPRYPVRTEEVFTYRWKIMPEDGPTRSDPSCLTRYYYSSIKPAKDLASGLIGPLLICFKESMDLRGNQVSRFVLFSVFNENWSWYLSENVKRYCSDAANIKPQDPEFYASNVMYSINGYVFNNLQMKLCQNQVVYWYVLNVGAQSEIISVFFSGNTFKHNTVSEEVLAIYPFTGETVIMSMDNPGKFHVKVSRTSLDVNPPAGENFSRPMKEKFDYDEYSNAEESKEEFDIYEDEQDPRMFTGKIRPYYIAAVEVTWDYGGSIPSPYLRDRTNWRKLSRSYKKVVFQEYFDSSFTRQIVRGELDEHLGILGPFIRGQVEDTIVVTFKNMASRPYSFHSNLLPYEGSQEDREYERPEAVQPNQVRQYSLKVLPEMAPSTSEFDCKAWAYFSSVNLVNDLHSGLIGPLIICQAGVLRTTHTRQLSIQEFSLLFTIFDETKSWYFAENFERNCPSPCRIQMDDPVLKSNHTFYAINGHVRDTLPGLVMGLHQRVRWYLLNAGGIEDIHAVHFHGSQNKGSVDCLLFLQLRAGAFETVEMKPSHPGIWRVECVVSEHEQAGMSALFLVYNKGEKRSIFREVLDNSFKSQPLEVVSNLKKGGTYIQEWDSKIPAIGSLPKLLGWHGHGECGLRELSKVIFTFPRVQRFPSGLWEGKDSLPQALEAFWKLDKGPFCDFR